jgi:hypothetical protein
MDKARSTHGSNENSTAWSKVLFQKLIGPHPDNKFTAYYATRMFTTTLTTFGHFAFTGSDKSSPQPPILFS